MRLAVLPPLAGAFVFLACSSDPGTTPPTNTCVQPSMVATFGGKSGGKVEALFVAPDGTVTVAGTTDDHVPSTSASLAADVLLLKLGADGTELSRKTFGSSSHDALNGAAFDANGAVVLAGYSAIAPITYGTQTVTGAYAAALDPSGTPKWLRPLPNAIPDAIAWAPDGTAWVVGMTSDTKVADLGTGPLPMKATYVAHLGADGAVLSVNSYATATNQHVVAVAPDGAVYFGGALAGTLDLDGSSVTAKGGSFVAKLEATKVTWATAWDTGFSGTRLLDLAPHAAGVRALVHFGSKVTIGSTTYTDSSTDYAVVISLDAAGALVSSAQLLQAQGSLSTGGTFDESATVIGGRSVGKTGPRITSFDPASAKVGASSLACNSLTKDVTVTSVVKDGAGNAVFGGTYDVPGPTSGGLTVVIPTGFVMRMKVP